MQNREEARLEGGIVKDFTEIEKSKTKFVTKDSVLKRLVGNRGFSTTYGIIGCQESSRGFRIY